MNEYIHTHKYTNTHKYTLYVYTQWNVVHPFFFSSLKEKETLPFATIWMDPEGITLSEISHIEKDKYHMISLICEI